MLKKRWYFTLTKGSGKGKVVLYLYRKDGKFRTTHALHSQYLLNAFQTLWYWLLFNLPAVFQKNGSLFAYKSTSGRVSLHRLEDYMLN